MHEIIVTSNTSLNYFEVDKELIVVFGRYLQYFVDSDFEIVKTTNFVIFKITLKHVPLMIEN